MLEMPFPHPEAGQRRVEIIVRFEQQAAFTVYLKAHDAQVLGQAMIAAADSACGKLVLAPTGSKLPPPHTGDA